ncbi:MAG TPA: putative quorum-sensing-regulated virulence factor, partial [Candidatus Wunengus sp. YC63]
MFPDKEYLLKIVRTRMPFGKYKGRLLIDLPEAYIV